MIEGKVGNKCTGCTACKSICPKNAITMKPDEEGFCYPKVNASLCVSCGLCLKVCPSIEYNREMDHREPMVFAAWNKNDTIRINSTSGGVFYALAESVIRNGGYVVGADYDQDFGIFHKVTGSIDELSRLKQSKYAQSDLKNVFLEIKNLLDEKKTVLFVGSPCQSVGLQSFLRKPYSNLITCDFICRGIISQKVYRKYLRDISNGNKITKVHFKNKDYGWNRFSTRIEMQDGSVYQKDRYEDSYLKGYLKHNLYMRPVCYECPYKSIPRESDLSLGDFWGIGNYNKVLDNDHGTSVIIVNSEKGNQLLSSVKGQLYIEERKIDEVIEGNSCLLNSPKMGEFREFFFENMDRYPFDKLIAIVDEKALHLTTRDRILRALHNAKLKIVDKLS